MRYPLSQVAGMATYIAKNKMRPRPEWQKNLASEIAQLCEQILARGKYIQLCTNGMFIGKRLKEFKPHSGLVFNVHLDGMEKNHDLAVEREGVFKAAIEGIQLAKAGGFRVFTNTT